MVKTAVKLLLRPVMRDCWNGWLYSIAPSQCGPAEAAANRDVACRRILDMQEIAGSPHPELRMQALGPAPESWAFGVWVGSELAGVCWVQAGETHRKRGGLIRLADGEAEMAQMTIASPFRGMGLATVLMRYSCREMFSSGCHKLYGKIWRDNAASIRLVERTGWKLERRFVSIRLRGYPSPISMKLSA